LPVSYRQVGLLFLGFGAGSGDRTAAGGNGFGIRGGVGVGLRHVCY
jgi:hypothetical protein